VRATWQRTWVVECGAATVPTRALVVTAATSASSDTDEEVGLAPKTSWNLKGLRTEVGRQVMRQFKKVSKADERLRRVRAAPHA
jgi:hypothetical protein